VSGLGLEAAGPLLAVARPFGFGASRVGREHLRVGRNNQDGWALKFEEGRSVGVVTDGCGSQPRSELGAQLGAQFLASALSRREEPLSEAMALGATDALCALLRELATTLDPSAPSEVLDRHFLFTFLAVVREGARTLIFGMGDGTTVIDGVVQRLEPGPDNAPEYCAYRLSGPRKPEPRVHFFGHAQVVAVMTDGFDLLGQRAPDLVSGLFGGAAAWRNPLTLQRRLNVLAEAEPLSDDATLVVLGG
jgi:hypothetical protein